MESEDFFCPLSGSCSRIDINKEPNSYFLIEPFNSDKHNRERAIERALDVFYKNLGVNYKLKVAGPENSQDRGLYCDICFNIRSSQFCIADITGDLYRVKNDRGKFEDRVFLRPNVAFELGMAYGFKKPTFIISGTVNGKRVVPSDISFIKYLDINMNFECWDTLTQNFLDLLIKTNPHLNINSIIQEGVDKGELKVALKHLIHLKEKIPIILSKKYKINQIIWDEYQIVGIITNAGDLLENISFNFYMSFHGIEKLVGVLKVYHVKPNGVAQVLFYYPSSGKKSYLEDIFHNCTKHKKYIPKEHRLELVLHDNLKHTIDNIDYEYLISIVEHL